MYRSEEWSEALGIGLCGKVIAEAGNEASALTVVGGKSVWKAEMRKVH